MVVVFEETFDTLDFSKWKFYDKGELEVKVEGGKLIMRYTGSENQVATLQTIEKFKLTPYGKVTVSFSGYEKDTLGNIFVYISVDGTIWNSYAITCKGKAIRFRDGIATALGDMNTMIYSATFEYDEAKNEISFYGGYLGGETKIATEKWNFPTKEVYIMLQGWVGSTCPEADFYDVKVEVKSQYELMMEQLVQLIVPIMVLLVIVSILTSIIETLK